MAMTVTATGTPGGNALCYLLVQVLDNAIEAGGASASGTNPVGGTSDTFSLTPNFSSSLPVWVLTADATVTAYTLAASNTQYGSQINDADTWSSARGYYSGAVTSGIPVTCGASAIGNSDYYTWAGYEIRPSGASTPAVDASSPAQVSAASACTTASFTPPPGSVLAALFVVSSNGLTDCSATVSGGGLTWTKRAGDTTSVDQCGFIFTATVPGGYPAQPSQPGGRVWRRRFRRPQTLQGPLGTLAAPPAPFIPPPLKGARAAAKGTLASIQVTPPRTAGPPAPFFPPRTLLRGAMAAVRGRLTAARGQPGRPSPFKLPGPLRGAPAARKGALTGIVAPPPVLHPVVTSVFKLPGLPLRGAPSARPGRLTGLRGLAGVPSPFQPPRTLLRGQPAARKGALAGAAAPPAVVQPAVPAPFFPPRTLLRGQAPATARTKLTGQAAPPNPPPPPATPRWQGATHMIAAGASGNLIQGARHTGDGGPGDKRGDVERSGD
jgi:hypothetical protein